MRTRSGNAARASVRVSATLVCSLLAASAAAQSTAGFPPTTAAPAPQRPAPPPYTPPPQYAPPPRYPGPQPYPQQPYPQQPYPQQPYPGAPYYPYGQPYPQAPPPAPVDPRLDEQMRYRQELGAYHRTPNAPLVTSGPTRTAYYRIADRTRYRHDGFYFRFAMGLGQGHDSVKSDRPLPTDRDILVYAPLEASGGGFAGVTEMAVGFTPFAGVVLGVGAYTVTIPKLVLSPKEPSTGDYHYRVSQLAVIGPVIDWYFNPASGFHAQASPGVATYVAGAAEPEILGAQAQAHTAVGFGFMLGVGYEWWIGRQWSLGLLGRFVYGNTKGNDDRGVQWTHKSYSPAVLLSATYH